MAIISSNILLRSHSLALFTVAWFLVASPASLLLSSPVWVLGEAMHIRPAQYQPTINPLTKNALPIDEEAGEVLGLAAVLFAALGIYELIMAGGLSIPTITQSRSNSEGKASKVGEEVYATLSSQSTHLNIAFLHVIASGALVAWIYVFHSNRNFTSVAPAPGLGALLGNQVIFSSGLIDTLFWGYLWTVIREERREMIQKMQSIHIEDE